MKSLLRDRTLRIGVLAGIISSIVVIIFLQPLLEYTWSLIVTILSKTYEGLLDRVYRSAARGYRDVTGFLVLYFSVAISPALLLLVALMVLKLELRVERLLAGDKEEKEESPEPKARPTRRLLTPLLAAAISMALIIPLTLILLTFQFADLQLNTSFQQRIAVLAPHISGQEEKEFRARWASMRSRNDYLVLNERLEKRAAELGAKLPEPLLR